MFAAIYVLWIRLHKAPSDDPRLTKGLQLLQSKIAVLEDLSDRTETQVNQLTALMENKIREIQTKIIDADRMVNAIEMKIQKSMEVAKIFQDKIPHKEILDRQFTIKYVKAAKLAHQGLSSEEISKQVDLTLAEIELILKLNKEQGKTILISSHILSEIEIICNRMIIIQRGKKVVEGSVNELLSFNELHVSFEFEDDDQVLNFIKQHNFLTKKFIEVVHQRYHFNLLNSEVAQTNKLFLDHGFAVKSMIPVRSLEDYFLNMT